MQLQRERLTYLRRWPSLTVEMASKNSRVETKRIIFFFFFFSAVAMMSFPVWNYLEEMRSVKEPHEMCQPS